MRTDRPQDEAASGDSSRELEFESEARDSRRWQIRADQLRSAAGAVRAAAHEAGVALAQSAVDWVERHELSESERSNLAAATMEPVGVLLLGLSVELLLKAALVETKPELVSGGKIQPPLGEHSTTELCRALGFELEPRERELLEKLADIVTWAGRYPVPKKAQALAELRVGAVRQGVYRPYDRLAGDDEAVLNELLARFNREGAPRR